MSDLRGLIGIVAGAWKSWWAKRNRVAAPGQGFVSLVGADGKGEVLANSPPPKITLEDVLRTRLTPLPRDEPPDLLRERAAFWAAATHDLCQPAQALALFLDRLRRQNTQGVEPALQDYLDSSMRDLSRLLEGLMEVAQIDAGEVKPAMAHVSVHELFMRVHQQLAAQAQAKGLRWAVRCGQHQVRSDAALLERIVSALAHNAVRFTHQGTVLLSARVVDGGRQLRLDVSDSGPGIAQRDHSKIFEPFGQRPASGQAGPLRPSLGLYIASRNAHMLGSSVRIRSALGRGSKFSVVLPLLPAHGAPAESTPISGAAPQGPQSIPIAFIDEDRDRALLVRGWLQSWGFKVLAADSLSSAPMQAPQAIVCAWQAEGPGLALETIAAWRGRFGAEIPACLIHVDADADVSATGPSSTTAVLANPLQPGQLRAWLRRSGLN
jgi:signal transduction histidine kinase